MQWVYPADCLGSGCYLCSGGTSSSAAPSPKPSSPAFETAPPQNQSPPVSHWTRCSGPGAMQGDTENHIWYHHLHFLMLFIQCGLRLLDLLYVWVTVRILTYPGAELMHDMSKLMEEGLHLMVLQEGGPAACGFCEVGHHGSYRHPTFPIRPKTSWLEPKACSMTILTLPAE